jgi:hypothetical protein
VRATVCRGGAGSARTTRCHRAFPKEPEPSTKNQVPGTSAQEPEPRSNPSPRPANPSLQGLIKEETKQLLNQLGVLDKPLLAQRIMDRVMLLNSDDSELLMTILTKIKRDRSD